MELEKSTTTYLLKRSGRFSVLTALGLPGPAQGLHRECPFLQSTPRSYTKQRDLIFFFYWQAAFLSRKSLRQKATDKEQRSQQGQKAKANS
jgi:hypothetical protein